MRIAIRIWFRLDSCPAAAKKVIQTLFTRSVTVYLCCCICKCGYTGYYCRRCCCCWRRDAAAAARALLSVANNSSRDFWATNDNDDDDERRCRLLLLRFVCVCRYLYAYVQTYTHTRLVSCIGIRLSIRSLSVRGALFQSPPLTRSRDARALCFVSLIFHCIAHIHTHISLPCWPLRLVWLRPKTRHCVVFHFPLRSLCTTWRAALLRRCHCCFSVFALAIPCVVFAWILRARFSLFT